MTAEHIAVAQIKVDEGFRANAYPDPLTRSDPWTVGYGCTGPGICKGVVWTQDRAEIELVRRVAVLAAGLDKALPWWRDLAPSRGAVLLNMAFNMGIAGLLAFKNTLAAIKAGDWLSASIAMQKSAWAKQVGARADRLADQMLKGVEP